MSINIRTPDKNINIHFPLYYLAYQGFPGGLFSASGFRGPAKRTPPPSFEIIVCARTRGRGRQGTRLIDFRRWRKSRGAPATRVVEGLHVLLYCALALYVLGKPWLGKLILSTSLGDQHDDLNSC